MDDPTPATAGPLDILAGGVVVVPTRHIGPYKLALRGGVTVAEAIHRSATRDRLAPRTTD